MRSLFFTSRVSKRRHLSSRPTFTPPDSQHGRALAMLVRYSSLIVTRPLFRVDFLSIHLWVYAAAEHSRAYACDDDTTPHYTTLHHATPRQPASHLLIDSDAIHLGRCLLYLFCFSNILWSAVMAIFAGAPLVAVHRIFFSLLFFFPFPFFLSNPYIFFSEESLLWSWFS